MEILFGDIARDAQIGRLYNQSASLQRNGVMYNPNWASL